MNHSAAMQVGKQCACCMPRSVGSGNPPASAYRGEKVTILGKNFGHTPPSGSCAKMAVFLGSIGCALQDSRNAQGRKANGEACTVSAKCVSVFCEGGKCKGKAEGQVCAEREECQSALCENGNCKGAPKKAMGQTCANDSDCQSGMCASDLCTVPQTVGWKSDTEVLRAHTHTQTYACMLSCLS